MRRRPDQVIADWRENARILRHTGNRRQATLVDRLLDEFTESMRDYLTWLSEPEAMLRSGKRASYFRNRFIEWADQDQAEKRGRMRFYRQVIVPRRANVEAARAEGAREAQREARAS